jgi:hypothetical protein
VDTSSQRYYLYRGEAIWDAARAACKAGGFDLPILRSLGESDALSDALNRAVTNRFSGYTPQIK